MNDIKVKRIYEDSSQDDGFRILVDRLWSRGVSKDKANIQEWAKDIAPSSEVRKRFNHDPDLMDWFRTQYLQELNGNKSADNFIALVRDKLEQGNVTLLYSAKDEKISQAVVLLEWLKERLGKL
ncbi:MAG TPA: DUF488 family protein [Salinivirgaceae bacterium]|nr:DUF488 family protein [Salinivirgaceae bacterium]HQB41870.1 DUF488 family protein [Candidatus Cloacimonadota bacterium]